MIGKKLPMLKIPQVKAKTLTPLLMITQSTLQPTAQPLNKMRFMKILKVLALLCLLISTTCGMPCLLEAIAKSALATREEISEIKNTVKENTTDYEKLATTVFSSFKNCYDSIQQQEVKFDDFKTQMQRELEQLKSNTSEAGLGEREHLAYSPSSLTLATSARCLGGPSGKISDPTFVDPNIVK